ncbi:Hemin uptake protein hemP [Bosea sp. 62]|uniref:hemin uptake protein HemP n=1 Tax=unclassified Bosea (in: a-proteobacteria) TaxID=2653178 RepID=UPI001253F2DF|nr:MULTISPECIES: hemin uptake protein HemP [unclassified Bosea (in: a-proteobacteria)]CAD5296122.1 Hemin uptake protein hemP [Bosea sp. 21B]CAD5296519.1 Hemin uptake protein hemP [Bosea sp. 46]CAD5297568.1 Hemin uptake protein hemP [Bosea sp. 7B]VVT61099.1 Hemin uptake protein hemP [Bosea sp. EC-HK365B]VXB14577.1 Hemin uptake protein hemP [Bosea sp. 125]
MNSQPLFSALTGSGCLDRVRSLPRAAALRPARTVASAAVFKGETEIGIEHHGELYRLRITRQGKLILTK